MSTDWYLIFLMCCGLPLSVIMLNVIGLVFVAWAPVLWNAIVKYPLLDRDQYRIGIINKSGDVEVKEPGVIVIPPYSGRGVVIPITEQIGYLSIEIPEIGRKLISSKLIKGKYSYIVYDPQINARWGAEIYNMSFNGVAASTINTLISERINTENKVGIETIKEELYKNLQLVGSRFGIKIKNILISES